VWASQAAAAAKMATARGPEGCGDGVGQAAAATTTVGRPGSDRQQQRARWVAAEMESGRARRLWGWNGPGGGSDDNGGRARWRQATAAGQAAAATEQ
jgi:hypothetical protein